MMLVVPAADNTTKQWTVLAGQFVGIQFGCVLERDAPVHLHQYSSSIHSTSPTLSSTASTEAVVARSARAEEWT